eukprot:jgi/Tetstr1/463994/TSEL_008799.t1
MSALPSAFRDRNRHRAAMYEIGLRAIPALTAQLPQAVRGMDDDERRGLAVEVLRLLPPPRGSEDIGNGMRVPAFEPLAEKDFTAALRRLHGAEPVRALKREICRHSVREMVDDGRIWDFVWALYLTGS